MKKISIVAVNRKTHNKHIFSRVTFSIYDQESGSFELKGKIFQGHIAREQAQKLITKAYENGEIL